MGQWTSIWGQAHTDITSMSPSYADSTMRISVRTAITGSGVRIRLSNREGKESYRIVESAAVNQRGKRIALRFQGAADCVLQPGVDCFSDPAELAVNAGELITISLAFAGKVSSGNNIAEHVLCSKKGNYVNAIQFVSVGRSLTFRIFDMAQAIPALASGEVLTEEKKAVIVCFGDSITQQSKWTKPLAALLSDRAVIINKGIGGNRLLSDPSSKTYRMFGQRGMDRFDRDVLEESGATAVILSIGTNDLGMVRKKKELKTCGAKALETAFSELTEKARKRGLKVYAATIPPRSGSNGFRPFQEEQRQIFNTWLRASTLFDAFLDFDAALHDPIHSEMLAFPYDSGDHLHPSALGGERLAECAATFVV